MSNKLGGGGGTGRGGSRVLKTRRSKNARRSTNKAQAPNGHNGTVGESYKQAARTAAALGRPQPAGRYVKGSLRG